MNSGNDAGLSNDLIEIRKVKMSLTTRLILSYAQWIVVLILLSLTIIAFIDIAGVGNNPEEWVGDDEDEVINGVKQKTGSVSGYVYVSLCGVAALISTCTFVFEWFIYRFQFVGYDLSWHMYEDERLIKKQMRKAITRSIKCHTICGQNYINFYKGMTPLCDTLFGLTIFHLIFERDMSRFAAIYPIVFFCLVCPTFFYGMFAKYFPTKDLDLFKRQEGLKGPVELYAKAAGKAKGIHYNGKGKSLRKRDSDKIILTQTQDEDNKIKLKDSEYRNLIK